MRRIEKSDMFSGRVTDERIKEVLQIFWHLVRVRACLHARVRGPYRDFGYLARLSELEEFLPYAVDVLSRRAFENECEERCS